MLGKRCGPLRFEFAIQIGHHLFRLKRMMCGTIHGNPQLLPFTGTSCSLRAMRAGKDVNVPY